MDTTRAREIIEVLVDGVNPMTGEVLSKESCFNEPEIIRALYTAKEQLQKAERLKNRKQPENAGKPWTTEDDMRLKEMYLAGKSEKELCGYFKRTRGAIRSRLNQLGGYGVIIP